MPRAKANKAVDRVIAHIRWLQPPYVGRAVLLVERRGVIGFVPWSEGIGRYDGFFGGDGDAELIEALSAIPKQFPAKSQKRARRPVA